MKDRIAEVVDISPTGPIHIRFYTVTEHEEGPVILSRGEQIAIVNKLGEDGYLKNINLDEDRWGTWLEMGDAPRDEEKIRRGNILAYIKTTDELLAHRELFEKALRMVGNWEEIQKGHIYKFPTEESNDDLIQLLIDLGIVRYDWKQMEKQTHRAVGNRIIEYTLSGNRFATLVDRVTGKSSRVKRLALELIAREIGERMSFNEIIKFFEDQKVPKTIFIQDTKWRAVFYILSYYTSGTHEQFLKFMRIIEAALHPLAFNGDAMAAMAMREKYQSWLTYDGLHIDKDGKVYLLPTDEENYCRNVRQKIA